MFLVNHIYLYHIFNVIVDYRTHFKYSVEHTNPKSGKQDAVNKGQVINDIYTFRANLHIFIVNIWHTYTSKIK